MGGSRGAGRRHVAAAEHGGLGHAVVADRDAEVGEHGGVVVGDEDVGRLDIPVGDSRAVRGLQRRREADADAQHLLDGEGRAAVGDGEAAAGAELHDEVGLVVVRDARRVDRGDRRVARELGHEVGLCDELLTRLTLQGVDMQHLDGDLPAGQLLLVEVDVGEPASAEHADVLEACDLRGGFAAR